MRISLSGEGWGAFSIILKHLIDLEKEGFSFQQGKDGEKQMEFKIGI